MQGRFHRPVRGASSTSRLATRRSSRSPCRQAGPGRSRCAPARPGQGADRTPRWHDAIKGGSARLARIIDGLFENAFVKVADLPERLGVTYPTAKADADRLLDAGILRELTDTSPRTLYAHELFAVAFMEPDGAPSVDR